MVIHLYRVTREAFYVYKFSAYKGGTITLLHVGNAYTKGGDYTSEVNKWIKKYSLNKYNKFGTTHTTAATRSEFLSSIYLHNSLIEKLGSSDTHKLPIHKGCMRFCQWEHERLKKEKEDSYKSILGAAGLEVDPESRMGLGKFINIITELNNNNHE